MRINKRFLGATVATLALAAVSVSGYVGAAVPQALTQQGRLLDTAGDPVDGDISIVFSLYNVATGGTAVWTETQTVSVDAGYFSARLGETTALTAGLFDGAEPLFLGMKVGNDAEMAPRQQVTSVPFAMRAAEADHAATADLATNATNAVNATNAQTAVNATGALTPTSITVNNKMIVNAAGAIQFSQQFQPLASTAATAGAASIACGANTLAISGACNVTGGSLVDADFTTGAKGGTVPLGFSCACTGAGCTVVTRVVCGPI